MCGACRSARRLEELHVGLDAAFARVQLGVDQVLDQPVGRALERHVLGEHHVGARLVVLPERLRGRDVIGPEAAGLVAGVRRPLSSKMVAMWFSAILLSALILRSASSRLRDEARLENGQVYSA